MKDDRRSPSWPLPVQHFRTTNDAAPRYPKPFSWPYLHHQFWRLTLYKTHSISPQNIHQNLSFPPPSNSLNSFPAFHSPLQKLANQAIISVDEESNKGLVIALYAALKSRDVDSVHRLLNPDLEWWFHGPPTDQFLMRLLTGASDVDDYQPFLFEPLSIAAFGPLILAEGCDPGRSIAWVHAWTVTDGIITHVREYFNTSVTVTRLGNDAFSPTSSESESEITPDVAQYCKPVWESRVSNRVGKSVPGLVLAL